MRKDMLLDDILHRVSLSFGLNDMSLIVPDDVMAELSLHKIAHIDSDDLDGELVFQSRVYMLFEVLLSYVIDKCNRCSTEVKRLDSVLSLSYEKRLLAKEKALIECIGNRISDKKIEKLVKSDDKMVRAINELADAENLVTTFKNILTGLDNRKDMLIQIASKRKREDNR